MVKNHLKRLNAPKTWQIKRKGISFIMKPNAGPHKEGYYVSLNAVIKDELNLADTAKEVRFILFHNDVLVDFVKRTNQKLPVGFMDVISFPKIEKNYRIILTEKGKLSAIEVPKGEESIKLGRIAGKKILNGKVQLNLHDGKNLIVDDAKSFKTGDSLKLSLPKCEILEHIKFEKGATAILLAGKHIGTIGKITNVLEGKIQFESNAGDVFETLKSYAFVIGKDKPVIKIQ